MRVIVHTRGFFRVIAREEDVEEEEAVVVGCFAGAHDHGTKQMDPPFRRRGRKSNRGGFFPGFATPS